MTCSVSASTASGQPEGEPDRMTSGLNAHGISLSRDGRLLAYSSYTQRANIWSVRNPHGPLASVRDAQQVTFGTEKIEKLAISWDGRWLAYDSDRNGQTDIWKMLLAGGTPEQMTRGPNNKFVNDWSPDGQEIVYHSMREGGQRDVMVVSADGMKTEAVASSSGRRAALRLGAGWQQHHLRSVERHRTPESTVRREARAARSAVGKAASASRPTAAPIQSGRPTGGSLPIAWEANCESSHPMARASGSSSASPPGSHGRPIRSGRGTAGRSTTRPTTRGCRRASGPCPPTAESRSCSSRSTIRHRRSLRREFATDGQRFYFTIASDESDLWAMELISK